jgi:hypothetical protein
MLYTPVNDSASRAMRQSAQQHWETRDRWSQMRGSPLRPGTGRVRLALSHSDLEVEGASIRSRIEMDAGARYEMGITGGGALTMRWGQVG